MRGGRSVSFDGYGLPSGGLSTARNGRACSLLDRLRQNALQRIVERQDERKQIIAHSPADSGFFAPSLDCFSVIVIGVWTLRPDFIALFL
jgi:hypothetical protein